MIRNCVLVKCKGNGTEAVIPKGVTRIEGKAFKNTTRLLRVTIPDGVKAIEPETFYGCRSLKTVTIPYGVVRIEKGAFENCTELTSIILPAGIVEIHPSVFANCPKLTVICPEDSYAHQYCLQNNLTFLFDYQFEAFHGLLPPGYEKLASPFLADEEKPYIFISYSHRDRDTVLPIIKELYESGWKIWYDEGLTIGDRYDETLETRVRKCTAFLLFVSKNSMNSRYCLEKEIPWAIDSGKQIIKCILDRGKEIDTSGGSVIATVDSSEIEPALEAVSGLIKGEKRVAKGITVVVNPAERERVSGDGIAYCLYASKNSVAARAILLEARNGGCNFYDAPKQGADEDLLKRSACLVVFLDKAFLADRQLTGKLIEAYRSGRDTAICQLEPIRDEDLPQKLVGLHKMQWLNFAYGINADASTKLVRHLEKRGCRNTAVLPGFKYEKTDKGIVITRYTGKDPEPRIESSYGGTPVTEIAENAFASCAHLKTIVIPENVTRIGKGAFNGCGTLFRPHSQTILQRLEMACSATVLVLSRLSCRTAWLGSQTVRSKAAKSWLRSIFPFKWRKLGSEHSPCALLFNQ